MEKLNQLYLRRRSDGEYEQYVMCELLIPNTPNRYGDVMTEEGIREAAFEFAKQGYGLDVNHDNTDVKSSKLVVVESFKAREGDTEFTPGSWVVGMRILDSELWQQVLDGELNGFSYEAEVYMTPVLIQNLKNRQVSGQTEPDPVDGHTHTYLVLLDPLNIPISGGTGVTNGHAHSISHHTVTDASSTLAGRSHTHRYQVLVTPNQTGEADAAGT